MFIHQVQELFKIHDVPSKVSIWDYAEAWKQFVQLCEDGYAFDIDEYDNDIYCRKVLQYVIDSLKLVVYPEYWSLTDRVKEFDQRFLAVIYIDHQRNDKDNWWEKGILKRAYSDYARDVKNLYNLDIEVLE
jgi:hypothetical protein